jgi:DNA-binding XRE family transcriptional regulator
VAIRRARLGLSQEDLAARIDTSQANLARIEEGQLPSTETSKRLAAALDAEPWRGAVRRPAIAVLTPVGVILGGVLSVAIGIWVAGGFSGTQRGDRSQGTLQALSAAPDVRLATTRGAHGKSRKAKESRETKRPETKSFPVAAAASEPSLARAPTTKERSPATSQPASEPVTTSPAPSSGGGGSNDPPPQAVSDPPPQVQSGIGGGETWHGIAPGGG